MNPATLDALAAFPLQLERLYAAFPRAYTHWAPSDWEGIPSETLSAIEQVCHVRDIEIDGYHVRLRRTRDEDRPILDSLDTYELRDQRQYSLADAMAMLADFREARSKTLLLISALTPAQLDRIARFDGYGEVSLRGLVHYLCSHDQQHLAGLQWLLGKLSSAHLLGGQVT